MVPTYRSRFDSAASESNVMSRVWAAARFSTATWSLGAITLTAMAS